MKATRGQLMLGFLRIYVLWGSTYLAIRFAVSTIPPFFMGGVRFIIAGTLLFGWSRWRGAPKPDREQWKNAAIIGTLLLVVGNGAVAWAEQRVDSGVASLIVATVPLWIVLGEMVQGRRPEALQWIGVAVGLVGVGILVMPGEGATTNPIDRVGAAALLFGSFSWTAGSLFSRTARLATPSSTASGMQMLCAGVIMSVVSAVSGEWSRVHPSTISGASILALAYLIVFGSIVGFSTYMWLLSVARPVAVGTYAYVNPLVAVFLGVVVAGEHLPASATLAMIVIVASVALVSLAPYLKKRAPKPAELA